MKRSAIISLLWDQFTPALEHFLGQEPNLDVLTINQFATPALASMVRSHGGSLIALEQFLDTADNLSIQEKTASLLERSSTHFTTSAWQDYCSRQQIADSSLLGQIIQARAVQDIPTAIMLLELLEKAADQFDILLLVVTEDVMPVSKTVTLWSKTNGIPSIQIAHSIPFFGLYTVHRPLHTDLLACYGERAVEGCIDSGIPVERCRVTGNPAWDSYSSLAPQRPSLRRELVERYRLQSTQPIVTFATTWSANLTALGSESSFGDSVAVFFAAMAELRQRGLAINAIVKDRPPNAHFGQRRVAEIAAELGLPADSYCYTAEDARKWVVASDLLIGLDSNILVEAMMVGTPAINILSEASYVQGPAFDGEAGVMEAAGPELSDAIHRLLTDHDYREALKSRMATAVSRYNFGVDGQASARVAALMRETMRPRSDSSSRGRHIWQQLLDVEDIDASGYHGGVRGDLVAMFTHSPNFVLDIGCAAGGTGAFLKQQYPRARVWGIEINKSAAALATEKLDKVLVGKFEDFDLEKEGIAPGSLDGVIVADVLEHLYNPWDVMVKLRPLLAPHAQVIASIPNVRNLALMKDLAEGQWRYESCGILDITHIRFFTLAEIQRFFQETGFRIAKTTYGIDTRLRDFYSQHQGATEPVDVTAGRLVLKNVTPDELAELCSMQFFVVAELDHGDNATVPETPRTEEEIYQLWLESRRLDKAQQSLFQEYVGKWPRQPRMHIALFATHSDDEAIGQSIRSLVGQSYQYFKISILSHQPAPASATFNDKVEWRQIRGDLLSELNAIFIDGDCDWVGTLNAGDLLAPHALLYFAEYAHAHPGVHVIYSDEDSVAPDGTFHQPFFKPDFNPDMLRGFAYSGGLALVRREFFKRLEGYDSRSLGLEEHDLMLRAFEAAGASAIGHLPDMLYHRSPAGTHCQRGEQELIAEEQRIIVSHLHRQGIAADVVAGNFPRSYRVIYHHAAEPPVSLILPAHDNRQVLQSSLESLVGHTAYADYEILVVDNGSSDPAVREYLDGIAGLNEPRLRLVAGNAAPLPELFNRGAQAAQGEFLVFLPAGMAALYQDWLDVLVSHARRPDIGAAGARIVNAEGKIRHAGYILGLLGSAASPCSDFDMNDFGYFGRLQLEHNLSAVAAAGMITPAALFRDLGGFAADRYPEKHFDVDYCLRLGEKNHRIVWTPYATLLAVDGTMEAGKPLREKILGTEEGSGLDHLYRQWKHKLALDPAYNRNLSLSNIKFKLDANRATSWNPLPWHPLPRILTQAADEGGCGEYRIASPLRALSKAGKINGMEFGGTYFDIAEIERIDPDTIVLQRQIMDGQIDVIKLYQRYSRALRVFEIDDLITNLPLKSIHRTDIPKNVAALFRTAVGLCDRLVVSTEPLRQAYRDHNSDIRVVPNFLERARWENRISRPRHGAKPRVGWAGASAHQGDLEIVASVVEELAGEVDWVFFGMCPDILRPHVAEFHAGVPIAKYPQKLASLGLDLAIAPLEYIPFNEAKSNLKLLEYGIVGTPVICTDITPYQGDFPVTRVRNRHRDWVNAIREQVADRDACARQGEVLRQHVLKNWMLEDHLDLWLDAWLP